MKKIISLLLAVVLLVGAVGSLSACGKKDSEIRIYLGDQIYDFDPALAFVSDNVSRVMSLIYEPLFRMDEDGDVEEALAESYKIIEDEEKGIYKMEIVLRDTYWNDGRAKVTADDIYFAWTRILDPEFGSQAAPLLYDIKNAVAVKQDREGISRNDLGLEANLDTITITFEGKIDYDAFLRNLTSVALVPLRENKVAEGDPGEAYWAKKVSFIATNGPFSIRNWNRETGEFTLQRNEFYHVEDVEEEVTDEVKPAQLITKWTDENFRNGSANMNAFLEDTFDKFLDLEELAEEAIFVVGEMPLDKELRTEYAEDAVIYDAFSTYTYLFNTNLPLFADENVRQALSMVIDRNYVAEQLVFAKAADGFISPAVWEATKKKTSFRSESEALIVTEARVKEAQSLVASVPAAERKFTLSVRNTPEEVLIAKHAIEQWSKLGFNVTPNFVDVDKTIWSDNKTSGGRVVDVGSTVRVLDDGIQAMYTTGQFEVLGLDYNMYSTNAFTALAGFTSKMNGNGIEYSFSAEGVSIATDLLHCTGFTDATYDEIMDRALAEKDLEKKAVILHEAEAYLLSKAPIAPIVYNQSYYLIEGVSGYDFDGYGNVVLTSAGLK